MVEYTDTRNNSLSGIKPTTIKFWIGQDSEERFLENLQTKERKLKDHGWSKESIIEYEIDDAGFRNPADAIIDGAILTLGCSHTFGAANTVESIWPTLLGQQLNLPIYNAGINGGSADSAFRVLTELVPKHKPKIIFAYLPHNIRWEIIKDGKFFNYGPWSVDKFDRQVNEMHTHEQRNQLNQLKNILALEQYSNIHSIPFIHIGEEFMEQDEYPMDRGRDLLHFGPKTHRILADEFLSKYNSYLQSQ